MTHHPPLIGPMLASDAVPVDERGRELEIAQRQALHEAVAAISHVRNAEGVAQAVIEAYLAAMRRSWRPPASEIGEGDYVIVQVGGQHVRLEAGSDGGVPSLALTGLDCDLDGAVDPDASTQTLYLEPTREG